MNQLTKQILLAAALATGVSGIALAEDTGDKSARPGYGATLSAPASAAQPGQAAQPSGDAWTPDSSAQKSGSMNAPTTPAAPAAQATEPVQPAQSAQGFHPLEAMKKAQQNAAARTKAMISNVTIRQNSPFRDNTGG
jgi:hypothetical protein